MSKLIRRASLPLRSRSGSVLILVVALLVLLALMGTAFISTTRNERGVAIQNNANTEADLLLQGLVNATQSTVVGELYGTSGGTSGSQIRPPANDTGQVATDFNYIDFTSPKTSLVLADRVPLLNAGNVTWPSISWPLFSQYNPSTSTTAYQFDSPVPATSVTSATTVLGPLAAGTTASATKSGLAAATIGSIALPNGQVVPALTVGNSGLPIVAADTDGDGIADAGLFKLPVSPVDGVTYYGAVRIVDGNSAINANTAVNNTIDCAVAGTTAVDAQGTAYASGNPAPVGFFPSAVGLASAATDYTGASTANTASPDVERAEYYLFNQKTSPLTASMLSLGSPMTDPTPVSTTSTARADFAFTTFGEMMSSQMSRRLNNPGHVNIADATDSSGYLQLTPFSLNDAAALASGFCLLTSSNSGGNLQQAMFSSLTNSSIPVQAYSASDVSAKWYPKNFDFADELAGGTRMPIRSILTTWNPVADYAPQHYVTRVVPVVGNSAVTVTKKQPINAAMLAYDPDIFPEPPTTPTTAVSAGQYVKYKDPSVSNAPYRCFQCIAAAPTMNYPISAAGVVDYVDWREEPWTDQPLKASVNTADFPTLWRAFYNVMADTGLDPLTPNSNGDSIPPLPTTTTPIVYSPAVLTSLKTLGWGPFRDVTRVPPTVNSVPTNALDPGEMLQLRAAVAAINTISMRRSDPNIPSRNVTLYSDAAQTLNPVTVTVFGVKPQPYITTVVADYDGAATPTLSIEIFNPTLNTIDLSNWQLAQVNRSASPITMVAVGGGAPTSIPPGTMLLPGQYLILQSTAGGNMTPGTGPPAETAVTIAAIGAPANPAAAAKEIVLLRTREVSSTNTPHTNTTANTYISAASLYDNAYDEGTAGAPNYSEMVPVDSIDFSGVFTAGAAGRRVYERANGANSATIQANWDFVYPGEYEAARGAAPMPTASQNGWGSLVMAAGTVTGAIYSDGTTKGGANLYAPRVPIQLATGDVSGTWVGKNSTTGTGVPANHFPYGTFARDGDILKVPFIGAYVVHSGLTNAALSPIFAANAITADAAMASVYDSLTAAGATVPAETQNCENIGRFVPLLAVDPTQGAFKPITVTNVTTVQDPYGFAAKIFDYIDVQVANDDDFPNADPRLADGTMANKPPTAFTYSALNPTQYPYNAAATAAMLPTTVANVSNSTSKSNTTFEESSGRQGLININTAPAFVLAQLPGVTAAMATQIVTDRNMNGPFNTIFDLNRVDAANLTAADCFQSSGNTILLAKSTDTQATINNLANDPGLVLGDFTPGYLPGGFGNADGDGVRNDFEEKTLMLTRISNLITTRSDTFTCYVELQGWRNAGTANATLAVQRRAAFILDRTNVTASNSKPQMFTVPNP